MKISVKRTISSLVLASLLALQILPYLPQSVQNIPLISTLKKASLFNPSSVDAVGISSMSATLSNPRLSFYGLVGTTITAGDTFGSIKATGTGGDLDTKNLFPGDSIIIEGNTSNLVASISSNLNFTLSTAVGVTAAADAYMYTPQGGTLKVLIYTASDIPNNGSIEVLVPAPATNPNDGIPFAETLLVNGGFDTNGMTNANTACPAGFVAGTKTAGTGPGVPHKFTCNNTSGNPIGLGTPLTVTIGDGTKPLINPAPIQGGHTRGIANVFGIGMKTWSTSNGSGSLLSDGVAKVAPVEGVLVTARVDETLSFTITGIDSTVGGPYCGLTHATGITTTATSVPWGTLNAGYVADANEAVQKLAVSTNAASGYKVYVEENDQMGLEGATCTGTAPSAGQYTFGASSCIRDVGIGLISHSTAVDWTTPTSVFGFGYATQGADAYIAYNTGGVYMARQFADQQGGEDKYATGAEVMSNIGPVDASEVFVCYRISIPGTQPAGYYHNKLKYTAVPKF